MFARTGVLLVLGCCAAGCSDRPRAAPLTTDAVYQNEKLGLRMVVPEGWFITSRTEPPSGALPKPIVLVSYVHSRGEKPAAFDLMLADVPEGEDLGNYLIGRKLGPHKWKPDPVTGTVRIGGEEAMRYQFESADAVPFRRDIYALRRGSHALYFAVTCAIRDVDRREEAVRCIESAVWTK